jgi:hypothetical protein
MEEYIPAKSSNVQRKQGSAADYDYKNMVVVASAWLLFYVVMLSGLVSNQDPESMASVATLIPH